MRNNYSLFSILSFLFHPIFIPLYTALAYIKIFEKVLTDDLATYLISLTIIGTISLPLLTISLLKKFGFIESFYLSSSKERVFPLISTGVYIYVTARLLMIGNINSPLNSYLIGIVVTLAWILIFSKKLKVSLHTASLSSSLGFMIYLATSFLTNLTPIIIILIFMIGLIATARIKLNSHSYSEIIVGVIFGIIPQLGFVFLY